MKFSLHSTSPLTESSPMDAKVFDNDFLHRHTLWQKCPSSLNDVSERDYPGRNYFDPRIDCLDMDVYERQICGGQANCTTDAVIGISDYRGKEKRNPRLLLVELKMLVVAPDQHLIDDMVKKVNHTKILLGAELPIERKSWMIFNPDVAPQARYWVRNKSNESGGSVIKNIEVYTVQEFADNVRCMDDLYIPEIPPKEIKERITSYGTAGKWKDLDEYIRDLLRYAEKNRYANYAEYRNVKNAVHEAWEGFYREGIQYPDEDTEFEIMILDEDITTILR